MVITAYKARHEAMRLPSKPSLSCTTSVHVDPATSIPDVAMVADGFKSIPPLLLNTSLDCPFLFLTS